MQLFKTQPFFLLLLLTACSSTPSTPSANQIDTKAVSTLPLPFPFKSLASDQTMALSAYLKGESCPNGTRFGSVAKDLQFVLPTLDEVEESMKAHACVKQVDVLKDLNNKPLLTPKGNTVPLWEWLCGDGTVVRVKPFGDPTSKFNRKPHGSVALRYPCDSKYESFDDEMFKIDTNGNPIPKWVKELDSKDPEVIETWAHSAHFPMLVTRKLKR